MATITKGKTFTNGETVTPQKLHELVDLGTVSGIVNADISASAAISDSKLAQITTAGKVANTATTATSANTSNAIVARDASGDFLAGKINGLTVGKGGGSTAVNTASMAIGTQALSSNTTGLSNTAVGSASLQANTSGDYNTSCGAGALQNNTLGQYNAAIGIGALQANTIGYSNTASGANALNLNTTFFNCGAFGNNAQITASNQVQVGDAAATVYAYGAVQDRSDIRDKADVRDTELGLEFVNALRPVDFKWDMREDYRPKAPAKISPEATDEEKAAYKIAQDKWLEDVKLANITHDGSKKRGRYHHGLIAQEVKAVLDSKGIDFGGYQDHSIKGGDDVLSIGYEELIAPMLKAIQELAAEIAALKSGK